MFPEILTAIDQLIIELLNYVFILGLGSVLFGLFLKSARYD